MTAQTDKKPAITPYLFRKSAQGPADSLIVFFHGANGHPASFEPLADLYAADFPGAAIDMPFIRTFGTETATNQMSDKYKAGQQAHLAKILMRKQEMTRMGKLAERLTTPFINAAMITAWKCTLLPAVMRHVRQRQSETGVPARRTILAGFSLGAGTALYTGLMMKDQVGGVVSYSGGYLGHVYRVAARPPVLFMGEHKERDMYRGGVLDYDAALKRLARIKVPVTVAMYDQEAPHFPGNTIQAPAADHARAFIGNILNR